MIQKSTLDYLKKLQKNNTRAWYDAHRTLYDEAWWNISDITMYLIDQISKFDETIRGIQPKDCIFRLLRDVRFSHDKTPFKTNFGIFIKEGGRRIPGAGYYLHIEPGNCMISGGIYMPPAPILAAIRTAIVENPDSLRSILKASSFKKEFGSLAGETVKTAPRGYSKDHPSLDLIRHKHFIANKFVSEKEILSPEFPAECIKSFRAVKDFKRYLNDIVNATV